jgi:hypothetical protein
MTANLEHDPKKCAAVFRLSKYADIALPTVLQDEAGLEYGIFIPASDTPGSYFFCQQLAE